jgi:hypothetical protein
MEIKKFFSYILSLFLSIIGFIPATIYSYVYSEFFTKYIYYYWDTPTDLSEKETKAT